MTAWVPAADVQAWIGADKITLLAAGALAQVASDAVQGLVQRDLSLQTNITDTVCTNGSNFVLLNYWPIRAIGSITLNTLAVQAVAPGQPGWQIDRMNPRKVSFLGYGKLWAGVNNVVVTGLTAGFDVTQEPGGLYALPGDARQALLLTAAAIFNSQAADPNLQSESTGGVFSGSFHPGGVGSVPPGAIRLLRNYIPVNP